MDYTSMHDWFYGPSDPTWILPTYDDPIVPQRAAYEQQMPELPNRRVYVKAAAEPPPPPPLPTTYYRLYPKVQTVTDGPSVRTVVEEPRDRVVEAGVPVVSQDAVRRESQLPPPPPPPPLKNLPIELKVPLCCEKCEKKVYDKLMDLSGVENVITDQYNQKVVVTGNVDPARVLNRVKHIKKRSVFWDQTVDYSQAYVRKQKERELAMIQAKKQEQAESAAAAKRNKDKGPNMTVILPEPDKSRMPYQTAAAASGDGGKGPNVTVILPESKSPERPNVQVILPPESDATRRMDYQSDQARVHAERYESRLRGHSQEFYNAPPPRWEDERHEGRQSEHHHAPFNPNYLRN